MNRFVAYCAAFIAAPFSSAWAQDQEKGLLEKAGDAVRTGQRTVELIQDPSSAWDKPKKWILSVLTQLYPNELGGWIACIIVIYLIAKGSEKKTVGRLLLALLCGCFAGTSLRWMDFQWVGWLLPLVLVAVAYKWPRYRPESANWLLAKWGVQPSTPAIEQGTTPALLPSAVPATQTLAKCPKCGKASLGKVYCIENCGYKRGGDTPPAKVGKPASRFRERNRF